MIRIKKSETADTRTCDWSTVSKETLLESSERHIRDVEEGLELVSTLIKSRGRWYDFGHLVNPDSFHDHDKISGIDEFHADFRTGFKQTGWWDNHRKIHRHHLAQEDGVPEDVNLLDVLEYISDCVMAGMARSGSVYDLEMPPELLERAFKNTVELLKKEIHLAE